MKRLTTETRGISCWRERLADPEKHWKRGYSAFEAALSWEVAARTKSGLPPEILSILESEFKNPELLIGVAEHKVPLDGGIACSQNDLWALIGSELGQISMTVEAKVNESFGNETLANWLIKNESTNSRENRASRWAHISRNLPVPEETDGYQQVPYQLLHRCAAAVIEARRFGLKYAICLIQAFGTPPSRFREFQLLGTACGLTLEQNRLFFTSVDSIQLGLAWVDSPLATETQIAQIA